MQAAIMDILMAILLKPGTHLEMFLSCVLGSIAFAVTLGSVGSALNLQLTGIVRTAIVLAIGLALNALVLGYLLSAHDAPVWMLAAAAAVLLLVVIAPIACFILKGGYLSVLTSMLLGGAGVIVVILFVHTGFRVFSGAGKSVDHGRSHKRAIEEVLDE